MQGHAVPSLTEIISWSVLQAMKRHPRFCAEVMEDDETLRQYAQASIGIAVSLPNDDLSMLRISGDECAGFDEFMCLYRERLAEVRKGNDHGGPHSLSISDLTAFHIHSAMPIIVSPAIATLCIGSRPEEGYSEKAFNLSFAFDHRAINGVGAARFLDEVKRNVARLSVVTKTETENDRRALA